MAKRTKVEVDHIAGPLGSDLDAIFPDNPEVVGAFIEQGVIELRTLIQEAEKRLLQPEVDIMAEQAMVRDLEDKFSHLFSDNLEAALRALSAQEDKDKLKQKIRPSFNELREMLRKIMRTQTERENERREANISRYGNHIEKRIFGEEERS